MNINIFKKKYIKNIPKNKGLTLVEMMVVIAIFLVITATVIFDYGSFRSNVSLQNLTDDVALAIRKAQSFAVGVRGSSSSFDNSYGVHFSINETTGVISGSNKSFLMFSSDSDPLLDLKYTDPLSPTFCGDPQDYTNKCMEFFKITSADIVEDIIIDDVSSLVSSPQASVDIVFTRPNPRAKFCYRTTLNANCQPASRVEIKISNGQLAEKYKSKTISVQNTGQISIE